MTKEKWEADLEPTMAASASVEVQRFGKMLLAAVALLTDAPYAASLDSR